MLLALNKPFDVLSQFTPEQAGQRTLAEFGLPKSVYALGRLDRDSEGLLLLSDERALNTKLLDPKNGHRRVYWAQVEGQIEEQALQRLRSGVMIEGRATLVAAATMITPNIPPRQPPIRERQRIPTSWIELELTEGRNRQVRKMTATVGFPTLRLIRARIGNFELPPDLAPGQWHELTNIERQLVFL
jgi:23S rRNA pseudouridine2457 synthase